MDTRCYTNTFCGHTKYVIRLVTYTVISKYVFRNEVMLFHLMFAISDIDNSKAKRTVNGELYLRDSNL